MKLFIVYQILEIPHVKLKGVFSTLEKAREHALTLVNTWYWHERKEEPNYWTTKHYESVWIDEECALDTPIS